MRFLMGERQIGAHLAGGPGGVLHLPAECRQPVPGLQKGGFGLGQVPPQLLEGGNIPRAGLGFLDGATQAVKLLYTATQHRVK